LSIERQQDFVWEISAAKWIADGRINFLPETVNASLRQLRSYTPSWPVNNGAEQLAASPAP
jgi:hypothetical protein